jgi:hypothetical protein
MTASKIEPGPVIGVGDADKLPAIITRASTRLAEARDSAEVMEAKQTAEAALHFAKLTKATNETHADCLRIITRAEMRMADEIDKGQAAGTISKRGRATNKKARAPDFYKELGVSKQRVAEWRKVRKAGSKKIDTIIESVLAEGRAPTKNDILKGIRREKADTNAKRGKPRAAPAVQPSLAKIVSEPDFQIEAAAEARDLEIERDERIALAGADALAAENKLLKKQNVLLARRIDTLLEEKRSLERSKMVWRKRALAAGWKSPKHA